MKLLTTLAALTLSAAALTAADPAPKFFNPAQEDAIRQIVREELKSAGLEAKPARPQAVAPSAPAAVPVNQTYYATYADAVAMVKTGRRVTVFAGVPSLEYTSRTVEVMAIEAIPGEPAGVYDCFLADGRAMFRDRSTPVFSTPVRSAAYQLFAPRSACANGQCPK